MAGRSAQRDGQDWIMVCSVVLTICVLALAHWSANYPSSLARADVVEGRAVRLEPLTKPGGNWITQNDVLTVDTGRGSREVFIGQRHRPYGMVLVGKSVVARLDSRGWAMSLRADGIEIIDFASSATIARKHFMVQTAFGVIMLFLVGLFLTAGIGMNGLPRSRAANRDTTRRPRKRQSQ